LTDDVLLSLPAFWDYLQQYIAILDAGATKVGSDTEMEALVARWLTQNDNGILHKIKSTPFFSAAEPQHQRVLLKTLEDRVSQVNREWQEIRSLFET